HFSQYVPKNGRNTPHNHAKTRAVFFFDLAPFPERICAISRKKWRDLAMRFGAIIVWFLAPKNERVSQEGAADAPFSLHLYGK
ncbi:hypothetical protein, partial [Porphyromonas loveana]|uniref:hypothetical protein n=1 Tax=Porphyromonas loveana TaxID=1884669 RepID=UPI0035A00810